MARYSEEIGYAVKRLQHARYRLLMSNPFFGMLLMHMSFSLDEMCETAYTDGKRIVFCPDFLRSLNDRELRFVLMHEVMHSALGHVFRKQKEYDWDLFNTACDIVVNSNILQSSGMDPLSITLDSSGVCMHLTPEGEEGYDYSAEEVFRMLEKERDLQCSCISEIELNGEGMGGGPGNSEEKEKDGMSEDGGDSEDGSDKEGNSDGSSCSGYETKNGKDGGETDRVGRGCKPGEEGCSSRSDGGFDDHTFWCGYTDEDDIGQDEWNERILKARQMAEEIIRILNPGKDCGCVSAGLQRILTELKKPQTDWKSVLAQLIQEEVCDYSFCPPDRRLQDSPFLLPDFNEKEDAVYDVLFMIDASRSMSDDLVTMVYSEICGALDQFDGRINGWVGYFDEAVYGLQRIKEMEDLMISVPKGGGGTSFKNIFRYIREEMTDILPSCVIILTDGYAEYPDPSETMDIPVLWIITNEFADPPLGTVTRINENGG